MWPMRVKVREFIHYSKKPKDQNQRRTQNPAPTPGGNVPPMSGPRMTTVTPVSGTPQTSTFVLPTFSRFNVLANESGGIQL